jgi:hypothetical protein
MSDPFDAFESFEPPPPKGVPEPPQAPRPEPPPPPAAPARRWATPPRGAVPDRPAAGPNRPSAKPERPAATPTALDETDLTTFRAVALPELRAAADRLGHRGHDVDVRTELDPGDPRLVLRFRPDAGPLAALAAGSRAHACFELRMGLDPNTGPQVVAGFTPSWPGALFVVLDRTRLGALSPDWVAERVIEFVSRTLERS